VCCRVAVWRRPQARNGTQPRSHLRRAGLGLQIVSGRPTSEKQVWANFAARESSPRRVQSGESPPHVRPMLRRLATPHGPVSCTEIRDWSASPLNRNAVLRQSPGSARRRSRRAPPWVTGNRYHGLVPWSFMFLATGATSPKLQDATALCRGVSRSLAAARSVTIHGASPWHFS
jgi:hypothetical protein